MRLRSEIIKITGIFLLWRLVLVMVMFLAIRYVPLGYQDRFLGGGWQNYILFPEIFSWANFDGEHYLSIAIFGYKGLEQAFFPVYPSLISLFASPFSFDLFSSLLFSTLGGLFISNLCFLISLIILWDLIRIDFPQKIAYWTILVLLVFPTSFYFVSVYSESIFLLFVLASFYFARKQKWLLAGLLGMIASSTRIFGILLLPALLLEVWQQKIPLRKALWICLIPIGLLGYMLYQWHTIGDPLAFYRLQKLVGEQHQSGITLLPQVYFRYIKMLLTVDISNPIYSTILLEFITGIFFFILPIYGLFKKIRLSYIFFALAGFLIPSIQGSFSSVPRYIIVFFPSFLAIAIYLNSKSFLFKITLVCLLFCWLILETILFLRGYWVA